MADPKVKTPLGRLQENFSWKDCLGTFLALLIVAAAGLFFVGPSAFPPWAYALGVALLAALSAIFTLGRRGVELLLRKLVGIGGLD